MSAPVDPKALAESLSAALAETKVLPRFSIPDGWRLMSGNEIIGPDDRKTPVGFFQFCDWVSRCPGVLVSEQPDHFYFRPINPTPQAPKVLSLDSPQFDPWINRGLADKAAEKQPTTTGSLLWDAVEAAAQAPEGTSPSMWMADSRPLLAEISTLSAQVTEAHKALQGILTACDGYHVSHHSTGWGHERDEAKSEVADEIADSVRAALALLDNKGAK